MDKKDLFKIVRENEEKFQKHIEKIHQLEEKEKKYNRIKRNNSRRRNIKKS